MISNYFKLALKILARKKFFTFISLFGISFTLMILMVITAFLENEIGSNAPLNKQDKLVFLDYITARKSIMDTTYTVDTTVVNGVEQYDSTENIHEVTNQSMTSTISYKILRDYFNDVPYVEDYTLYSRGRSSDVFVDTRKIILNSLYTDSRYWEIYQFNFLEGGPYKQAAIESQEQVIVISDRAKSAYFGDKGSVIDEEIRIDDKHYRVIGVVEHVTNSRSFLNAELYIPYTQMRGSALTDYGPLGSFEATFVAQSSGRKDDVSDELKNITAKLPIKQPDRYNSIEMTPKTYLELYSHRMVHAEDPQKSKFQFFMVLFALLGLFIFLPTLNLINVNVTRILERSSEIGVRKAFGATRGNLLFQFVFENIILTLLGGIIGFVLAIVLIDVINDARVLPNTTLQFNIPVFIYSFLICILFGIISGLIPALRMSRLKIVTALKEI